MNNQNVTNPVSDIYIQALKILLDTNETKSISLIQRKCSIGYPLARKIVNWLEENHYANYDSKKREIVFNLPIEQLKSLYP